MNDRMHKRFERYRAVATVLNDLPAEARLIPGLVEKVALFHRKIAAIHVAGNAASKPTSAATIESRQCFEALIDAALHLAGVIGIVARDRNQPHVAEQVKVTRNDFVRLRSPNRTIPASRIAETAAELAPDLVPYGITEETLAGFQQLIAAAQSGANAPRAAIGARRAAAVSLAALFKETDALLTYTIDVLMLPLRRKHSDFYTQYQVARTVNRRSNGSRRKEHAQPAAAAGAGIPA